MPTFVDAGLEALDKYHPGWDQWEENELVDPDTINREIVMIPPSFDLLRRFFGPTDRDADGVDVAFVTSFYKGRIAGDEGEEKLFNAMTELPLGGIFISGISISHITARRTLFEMSDVTRCDASFERRLENDAELYAQICSALQEEVAGVKLPDVQEMDGLYLHPIFGVCFIEIKNKKAMLHLDEENNLILDKKFAETMQLEKYELIVKQILRVFDDDATMTGKMIGSKIAFLAGNDLLKKKEKQRLQAQNKSIFDALRQTSSKYEFLVDEIVDDIEKLTLFFKQKMKNRPNACNFFAHDSFRKLIAILVGSRPDIFISPVKCVLHWHLLLVDNAIGPIALTKQNRERQKSSMHNESVTGDALLKTYFPAIKSNVTFVDGNDKHRPLIFFTKRQQEAIVNSTKYPIIRGAPGSGKSMVQMMRVFIALQDASRNDDCLVATAHHHMHDYFAFLRANNNVGFRRDWTVFFHAGQPFVDRLLRDDYQFFVDEISPEQFAAHFANGFHGKSLVLSSLREGEHYIDAQTMQYVIELKTHFRSTQSIARYWQKYYMSEKATTLTIGHHFMGIPPEHYRFEHVHDGMRTLEHRIATLIQYDGCSTTDFAIFFATYAELFTFASYTRLFDLLARYFYDREDGRFKFFFRRPENAAAIFDELNPGDCDGDMESILRTWDRAFHAWFASIEHDARDEDKDAKAHFDGFSLLALEAREFSFLSNRTRETIDHLLVAFIRRLDSRAGSEDLDCMARMTKSDFDEFTFASYLDVHSASVSMQACVVNAVCYLQEIAFENAALKTRWIEYFKTFLLVNTWPRLLSFEEIASIETPIVVFFTAEPETMTKLAEFDYSDLMSLVLSRAQSHLIIFEWTRRSASGSEEPDDENIDNEDDHIFAETVLNAVKDSSLPLEQAIATFHSSFVRNVTPEEMID